MTDPATAPTSAWGHALVTLDEGGAVLDAWFPAPALGASDGSEAPGELTALAGPDDVRRVSREVRLVEVTDLQAPPSSTEDAWLRLHLLSHRLVAPRTISMDGIFGLLTNVVWTNGRAVRGGRLRVHPGAADGDRPAGHGVRRRQVPADGRLRAARPACGSRDADRVRLGAHLAEGTTVMHEGFVQLQRRHARAPRWSRDGSPRGVVVGDGSDVGGGASIMGTLSGGGTEVISVGKRCLIGANAGIGISLGDDCVVEAGLLRHRRHQGDGRRRRRRAEVVKARELSGVDNVLFRRNSVTGAVEAVPWRSDGVALNAALHAN